jgi:NAD(P)-dependent dehydrogenase (short-subunit alcohol dehydrogenase family)
VGSGLGRDIAAAAVNRGDTVYGVLRRDPSSFEALGPGRAIACVADVREPEAVRAAVARAEKEAGAIDILVNNAGRVLRSYVEDAKPQSVRDLFETNLIGVLNCLQAALPGMRARGAGKIFNMSSGAGIAGLASLGIYNATKFALEGLSEALALEVGGLGIQVVTVEPGAFRTNLQVTSIDHLASEITDYEATAGEFRAYLDSKSGKEEGDPAKFAEAFLRLVDHENPPQRVALGDGGLALLQNKAALLAQEAEFSAKFVEGFSFDVVE